MKVRERSSPAETREEGGQEVLQAPRSRDSLQPMVRKDVLLQPTEVLSGGVIHMQPREDPMTGQADVPCRKLWPCAEPTLEQFSWDTFGPVERSPHWNRFADMACDAMGDPGQSILFQEEFTLWKTFLLGQFVKDCVTWEGYYTGVGSLKRKE